MATSYIFISGGVISGIGKGTVSAALCSLLKYNGYKIASVKCENYLNVDAGLINPIEHGDVFLCEDGTEGDMDLGTYERFLDKDMAKHNFITMGQIYKTVIDRERAFGYNGEDVEAVPHVCDEIISRIKEAGNAEKADIVVVELGGTCGEYQNALYYEASRIMSLMQSEKIIHIHVSYLPTPRHLGEPKTKPTQLSVKTLNSMGIQPNMIISRSEYPMDTRRLERFALFCNVHKEDIISCPDVDNVYYLPILLHEQNIDGRVLEKLGLSAKKFDLSAIEELNNKIKNSKKSVKIAIVGKYFSTGDYELKDSYAALFEAIDHAGWNNGVKAEVVWVNAEKLEKESADKYLKGVSGVIVPIGWGARGTEGMIKAIEYARTKKIPYLGLCYGMQLAVVEFARNVLGLKDANTTENAPDTKHPVIHMIPEQERILSKRAYGGTMRLGSWDCKVTKGTLAYDSYKKFNQFKNEAELISSERHRHRYEFNDDYAEELEKAGLVIGGRSIAENLVELIELPKIQHPFFLGTQGHPEYKSRPLKPHAFFLSFIEAVKKHAVL